MRASSTAVGHLRTLGVILTSVALLHHYQFLTESMISWDGYYHIKYAYLLRTEGFLREFRWAPYSLWATQFSDKELLFHVLLIPFTAFRDLVVGAKYGALLVGTGAMVSFYAVLRLNRLRFPELWFLLLCGSGSLFLYRLLMPRPQVLSVILLLWVVHFIIHDRRLPLAVVAWVYSLSHTGFHLSLILALCVSTGRLVFRRELEWKTPLAVLAGILAGMLANPYFPNNLTSFYVQNILVPWMAVFGDVGADMAVEVEPLNARLWVVSATSVAVPYVVAAVLALVRPRRVSRRTADLFVVSGCLIAMTFVMRRFAEYSIPLTLFFLASFFTDRLQGLDLRRSWRDQPKRALAAAGVTIACLAVFNWRSYGDTTSYLRPAYAGYEEAAVYLEAHTEENEIVFTCDWDDAPGLFFYNHWNRYLVFLDPNYMVYWDREFWDWWRKITAGEFRGTTYNELAAEFHYGVCSSDEAALRWIIDRDPRIEIVLENEDVYVFEVSSDPEIPLEDFLTLGEPG